MVYVKKNINHMSYTIFIFHVKCMGRREKRRSKACHNLFRNYYMFYT